MTLSCLVNALHEWHVLAAADQQQHADGEREPVVGRAADQAAIILSLEQQLSAKDWLLTQLQVWTGPQSPLQNTLFWVKIWSVPKVQVAGDHASHLPVVEQLKACLMGIFHFYFLHYHRSHIRSRCRIVGGAHSLNTQVPLLRLFSNSQLNRDMQHRASEDAAICLVARNASPAALN